jgi:hypothetical protein
MCFDCRAIVTGGSRKRMVAASPNDPTIPEKIPETAVSRRQLPAVNFEELLRLLQESGRGDWIRTSGLSVPNRTSIRDSPRKKRDPNMRPV